MKLKNYWDNKSLLEKCLMIFIVLIIIFLICMYCMHYIQFVSALTEEERIESNRLITEMKEKGEILIPEIRDYSQDLNPFFILGVLTIGIIILVTILIRLMNRDRL